MSDAAIAAIARVEAMAEREFRDAISMRSFYGECPGSNAAFQTAADLRALLAHVRALDEERTAWKALVDDRTRAVAGAYRRGVEDAAKCCADKGRDATADGHYWAAHIRRSFAAEPPSPAAAFPHKGCRTYDKCRQEQHCFDAWNCSAAAPIAAPSGSPVVTTEGGENG